MGVDNRPDPLIPALDPAPSHSCLKWQVFPDVGPQPHTTLIEFLYRKKPLLPHAEERPGGPGRGRDLPAEGPLRVRGGQKCIDASPTRPESS